MHGTDDDIVPIESGMAIQEAQLRVESYGVLGVSFRCQSHLIGM